MITITSQPAAGSLNSAYRPIIISATITGTPPVTYCDVYIGGTYYKTISKTQPPYDFDIQDAVQESFTALLPYSGDALVQADPMSVSCKIRSSALDVDGFIIPDGAVPIQATGGTPATAGGGTASNTFICFNAALQYEDNPVFASHLLEHRYVSYMGGYWQPNFYPLTNRPLRYFLCRNDGDAYPIYNDNNSILSVALQVRITMKDGAVALSGGPLFNLNPKKIILLPFGPKNLDTYLTYPTEWKNVKEYQIEVLLSGIQQIYSCRYILTCCCQDDRIKLFFMNYLGQYDAVVFQKPRVVHEVSSSEYKSSSPNTIQRYDIRSNDTLEARTSCYDEESQVWLQEIADSPKVFIERTAGVFVPVVITSKKFEKMKTVNEFRYDFVLEFKYSNEFTTLRN